MKHALYLIALLVLAVSFAFGQATTTSTTLSAAVSANDEYVTLTSATGVSAMGSLNQINTILYMDREAMAVRSLSGTRVRVFRAQFGTSSTAHAASATVYLGPATYFKNDDPFGPCTAENEVALPTISIPTGNVFQCTNSVWVPISFGGTAGSTVTGTGGYVLATSGTLVSPTITTDIRATTAGSPSIGTAAKPFGSLIVGTAATNVFTFTPAALGAARAISIADPGGADTLTYNAATQTLTNKTLTSPTINGMVATGRNKYSTVPIGSVAYNSFGNATTGTAASVYCSDLVIERNMTVTGIGVLNGGTVGTDKWIVALYATAGGTVLANSALAGTTSSGANAMQEIAFTGTYAATGPARYWACVQTNGTTDNLRTVAASTFINVLTKETAGGVYGTMPSLAVPTTFSANVGPIAYVY